LCQAQITLAFIQAGKRVRCSLMGSPDPVSLARFLGARLRAHREAGGRRQEELAAAARAVGFSQWTRGTVAMVESGRRRLTLEEFIALPIVLDRLGITATLPELLAADGMITVTSTTRVSVETVRGLLAGRRARILHAEPGTYAVTGLPLSFTLEASTPALEEVRRLWQRGRRRRSLDLATAQGLVLASQGGAERHAAQVLGTTSEVVAILADDTWGRSLTAERDARVNARVGLEDVAAGVDAADRADSGPPVPLATVQAHRGHVTRELIEEIRPAVKPTKTRRRGRT
jgi:transcriptional regulator with XRE-family HTH domain